MDCPAAWSFRGGSGTSVCTGGRARRVTHRRGVIAICTAGPRKRPFHHLLSFTQGCHLCFKCQDPRHHCHPPAFPSGEPGSHLGPPVCPLMQSISQEGCLFLGEAPPTSVSSSYSAPDHLCLRVSKPQGPQATCHFLLSLSGAPRGLWIFNLFSWASGPRSPSWSPICPLWPAKEALLSLQILNSSLWKRPELHRIQPLTHFRHPF